MKRIRDILPKRDRSDAALKQGTQVNPDHEKQSIEENNQAEAAEESPTGKDDAVERSEIHTGQSTEWRAWNRFPEVGEHCMSDMANMWQPARPWGLRKDAASGIDKITKE